MWKLKYYNVLNGFLFFFLLGSILSCGTENDESEDNDTIQEITEKPFSVADAYFAIKQDKDFIAYNKAIYHRGDEVFLVLKDVGPFKAGSDSMNMAEMKITVNDGIGQQILLKDSILGERGHKKFTNNMLGKPYGSYESGQNDKPGKYTICVTIYDLIGRDSVVVCDDFYIE